MPITVSGTSITFNDSTTQTTAGLTGSSTQLCKAWVRYNGDAQTVTNSYNVSSVTYNSTGDYTINFTNAFANTNYTMAGSAASAGDFPASIGINTVSTTSCGIRLSQHNLGARNRVFTCATFFNT
jgi:hypothetical protein